MPLRRGLSMIYLMLAMVGLTGIISMAVDLGRVQLAKTELQQAVDAAARYGATGLPKGPGTVRQRVNDAAAENKIDGQPLSLNQSSDIEFGMWNPATRTFTPVSGAGQSTATAVRVTARRNASRGNGVPTLFGSLLGRNFVDINATAVAGFGQGADVVLVQDITSSFTANLPDAKLGDQAMIDALYSNGDGRSRVAILVHTGWGKTLAPLTAVGTSYSYLSSTISSIQVAGSAGMPAASGTDIAAGFDEALNVYTAAGYVEPAGGKTVVLVSDGDPSASSAGSHPTLDATQLLALAQQRADELWAQRVHVYIVFFDKDDDAAAAARLQTLTRGSGIFVRVQDPKQLPKELEAIVKKLPLQLVK
ncbi:hypothetical protein BH09PLA1_BH09PLA1_07090 [soil metagenome]